MTLTLSAFERASVGLATRRGRVVLAESDLETRRLLAFALRKDGHDVIVARDGDELLEHLGSLCLEHERPDVIIGDARLPGGLGRLASLLEDDRNPTPVIVITDRSVAVETRLDAVVTFDEPLDFEALRDAVRTLLEAAP